MEEVKRKRGRPRKVVQLPEEIQKIVDEVKEKESQEIKEIVNEVRTSKKGKWDFLKDDPIEFFDVNMSYEITGYRPINEKEGLDFDPNWFTEARETFLRTGHYCSYPRNSKAYADFWNREYLRCREGMTVNGYTITGDHYFFLNYYQLMDLSSAKKAGSGRIYAFPTFYVGQYEWFHYVELAKVLRLNAFLMKSREVGYSEIDSAIIVNNYNCRRNTINLIVAHLSDHLNKTLEKVWRALSFLNDYTDGGFFKLRQVIDKQDQKRASHYKIVNGQKVETGWMSQITGIVADKPHKIRGDRTDLLIYEEAGSWEGLIKAFIQSNALVGQPGDQWGLRIGGGTGGDKSAALEGLRQIYYDPKVYGVLPFRHNYTQNGETALTAFFIPCTKIMKQQRFFDKRGFVDPVVAKEYWENIRASMSSDPKALVTYSAEYCFNAEEAFSLEGDNKFNKVNIAEQITQIRVLKKCPPIDIGNLEYTFKNGQHSRENITGFQWKPNPNGKIKILEHPIWTIPPEKDPESGNIIKEQIGEIRGLYVIGIDGIDIGASQTSEYTKDPSDFCLVVKKRVYGMGEPQYVAIYKDRPNDIRDAYKTAIKLAQYYNAVINIEATRMSLVNWARDHKYLNYFMKRPRATLTDVARGTSKQYGTPATAAIIAHQTDLIADYVNDYCHTIWFEEMLDELNRYTDENKRKFDIIAAMSMAELADEELSGVVPKQIKQEDDTWDDIGFYIDDNGHKRWGVIPRTQQPNINVNHKFDILDDNIGIRSSDPRRRLGFV